MRVSAKSHCISTLSASGIQQISRLEAALPVRFFTAMHDTVYSFIPVSPVSRLGMGRYRLCRHRYDIDIYDSIPNIGASGSTHIFHYRPQTTSMSFLNFRFGLVEM